MQQPFKGDRQCELQRSIWLFLALTMLMKYKQLIVNETFADGKLHKLLDNNKKFNEKKKKKIKCSY